MVASMGAGMRFITPLTLRQCWLNKCFNRVPEDDSLGLCPDCVEELRYASS